MRVDGPEPLFDLRIRSALHPLRIEDYAGRLLAGLAQIAFDSFPVTSLRRLHLPDHTTNCNIWRSNSISPCSMRELDIVACIRDGACGIHLMLLDIEIGRRDYLSLMFYHAEDYIRQPQAL